MDAFFVLFIIYLYTGIFYFNRKKNIYIDFQGSVSVVTVNYSEHKIIKTIINGLRTHQRVRIPISVRKFTWFT